MDHSYDEDPHDAQTLLVHDAQVRFEKKKYLTPIITYLFYFSG